MDDLQFYPTPDSVIALMIEPMLEDEIYNHTDRGSQYESRCTHTDWSGDILDPSAGDGAILDWIAKRISEDYPYNRRLNNRLYACELDYNRRAALLGKEYRVIGSDWLEYNDPKTFGLIAMNPPFADADSHILKAWEHLADDGRGYLVAVLNSETITNPYTKERKILASLIEEHGTWEDIGPAFKDSDRPTDVNVALVRLRKPKAESAVNFDATQFATDSFTAETFDASPLAGRNAVKSLIDQYNAVVALAQERSLVQSKIDFYLKDITAGVRCGANDPIHPKIDFLETVELVKAKFWNEVFRRTKMEERMPSNFSKKFEAFAESQRMMAFTEGNIWEVLQMFLLNRDAIMTEALLQTFDKATGFHEKNRIHIEGWKTNKAHRLNKRIIYPYGVRYSDEYGSKWEPIYRYRIENFYEDIDKVLCHIGGLSRGNIQSTSASIEKHCRLVNAGERSYTEPFESSFFKMRVYKKGTVHMDFLDLKLLEEFNLAVAHERKWIADTTDAPKPPKSKAEPQWDETPIPTKVTQITLF
jgi:hypothetical protein